MQKKIFKKSSFCGSGKCCVEVAIGKNEVVLKDTQKKEVSYSFDEWKAFIKGVKNREFDL